MASILNLDEPSARRLPGIAILAGGTFLFVGAGLALIDLFAPRENDLSADLGPLMLSLVGVSLIAIGGFIVARRSWLVDKAFGRIGRFLRVEPSSRRPTVWRGNSGRRSACRSRSFPTSSPMRPKRKAIGFFRRTARRKMRRAGKAPSRVRRPAGAP